MIVPIRNFVWVEDMDLLDKFGEYFIGDFFDQSLALLFQNPLQNLELKYKIITIRKLQFV